MIDHVRVQALELWRESVERRTGLVLKWVPFFFLYVNLTLIDLACSTEYYNSELSRWLFCFSKKNIANPAVNYWLFHPLSVVVKRGGGIREDIPSWPFFFQYLFKVFIVLWSKIKNNIFFIIGSVVSRNNTWLSYNVIIDSKITKTKDLLIWIQLFTYYIFSLCITLTNWPIILKLYFELIKSASSPHD